MDSVAEIWKAVRGFEGMYEVSDQGQVRSLDRVMFHPVSQMTRYHGRLLVMRGHRNGYDRVQLCGRDRYVHRLVVDAFIGPPLESAPEVNHKNGDKKDNRLENLEYCSRAENVHHAIDTGLFENRGERHYQGKLTEAKALEILHSKESGRALAKRFGVDPTSICDVRKGRTWSYLKKE